MAVWTMDQVHAVERLYVRLTVDAAHGYAERAAKAACDELFRQLVKMAHTHAVELHPGDCEVHTGESAYGDYKVISMRWRPSTNAVELRGGPGDGRRVAVQQVGDPLRVAVQPPVLWAGDGARSEALPRPTIVTYSPAGWNEAERVWVYEPR